MRCWGLNDRGQLGNGAIGNSTTGKNYYDAAIAAKGGTTANTAIAVGLAHTCAITKETKVKCWGDNTKGQLGNGATSSSPQLDPVYVHTDSTTELSEVKYIAAGGYHTCAILTGNTVKCWGYNNKGQLGTTSTNSSFYAATVQKISGSTTVDFTGASSLALGYDFSCAIATVDDYTNAVLCWGDNTYGELGNGISGSPNKSLAANYVCNGTSSTDSCSTAPLINTQEITAHGGSTEESPGHACAVITNNTAKCWGDNTYGELGNGTTSSLPVVKPNSVCSPSPSGCTNILGTITHIATGALHTCATLSGGGVMCWGSNLYGMLGNASGAGTSVNTYPLPAAVTTLSGSTSSKITAGNYHSCVITNADTVTNAVKCWGYDVSGQLGDYSTVGSGYLTGAAAVDTIQSTPIITLSSSNTATAYEDGFTLTAKLTLGNVPTGTVAFTATLSDGSTAPDIMCNGTTNTTASVTTNADGTYTAICKTTLAPNTYTINATYSGDMDNASYATSTYSKWITQTVDKAVTQISATGADAIFEGAALVTINATVTGPFVKTGDTGDHVTISEGSTALCSTTLTTQPGADATGKCNTYALLPGQHTLTATYSGNSQTQGSSTTYIQRVLAKTITTAKSSSSTAEYDTPITLTAKVEYSGTATVTYTPPTLTGRVTFMWGATTLCDTNTPNTSASSVTYSCAINSSALGIGTATITANYEGSDYYLASTGSLTQTVTSSPSHTTLTANPISSAKVGDTLTLTAAVIKGSSTAVVSDGMVSFYANDAALICSNLSGSNTVSINNSSNGQATCTTQVTTASTYSFKANYSNSASLTESQGALSYVIGKANTTTTLTSLTNQVPKNEAVALTATINTASATRTIRFMEGSTALNGCDNITLTNATAICSINSLSEGMHAITAVYTGDSNYNTSTSTILNIEIVPTAIIGDVHLVIVSGNSQTALINTAMQPLVVQLQDSQHNPINQSVDISFVAPEQTSASAELSLGDNLSHAWVTTNSNGQAGITPISNGIAGSYTIHAWVCPSTFNADTSDRIFCTSGDYNEVIFDVTNTP